MKKVYKMKEKINKNDLKRHKLADELFALNDSAEKIRNSANPMSQLNIEHNSQIKAKIYRRKKALAKLEIKQMSLINKYIEEGKKRGLTTFYSFVSAHEHSSLFSNEKVLKDYLDNENLKLKVYKSLGFETHSDEVKYLPAKNKIEELQNKVLDYKRESDFINYRLKSPLFNLIGSYRRELDVIKEFELHQNKTRFEQKGIQLSQEKRIKNQTTYRSNKTITKKIRDKENPEIIKGR